MIPPPAGRHLLVLTQGPANGITLRSIEAALTIKGVGLTAGSWEKHGSPISRAMGLPPAAGEGPGESLTQHTHTHQPGPKHAQTT